MKNLLLFFVQCLACFSLMAQVPQAFKYQAVARDINGDLLTNQTVSFLISILQGSASGTAVYVETHTSMTNDYGLVNLEIGNGTVVSGSFSAIDWGGDSHYLKVEMDPAGGTLYQAMGTSQLLSVPYALQSGDSPPDDDWTITGNNQYSAVTGNVGIGTSTPGQRLSVVGRVRAANAADETEYAEIYHGGSNALLHWAGDGNLDFRYNNTTLATVSQENTRFYVPRPEDDYGADKSCLYGYRFGGTEAANGGTSWAVWDIDAAVKGYSFWGNNYTAGVAGYSYLDYEKSAAVIGSKYDGSVRGFLAYRDDASKDWAGYFNGDVKVNGTLSGNGSGLINLPADGDWTVSGNDMYSAVTGNVGIGTSAPETDLAIYSDANNQGLTLRTSDNTFNQGIRFRNSGGSYTWHLYRKDAGSNNADLVFANGSSNDITALTDRIVFKNGGKVGIGTSSPGQQLTVIGAVRGSNDAAQTEYVEMSHGGGNGFINWTGDGNLEFRYGGTALAHVVQAGGFDITAGNAYMIGGNKMLHNEGTQNLFAGYQAGLDNTGLSATFVGYQAGASGNSANFNTFVGSKAGQQNLGGSNNTFIGNEAGQQNSAGGGNVFIGSAAGDGSTTGSENIFVGTWAGGFNATGSNNTMIGYYAGASNANQTGNVFIGHNAGRNETGSNKLYIANSGTSSPLIWGDFSAGAVNINGNLGVGTTTPDQKFSVVGTVRGAADAAETEYVELTHGGSHGYINWNGDGNLDFRYNGTTLATLEQSGNMKVTGSLYVTTLPLGDKKNVQWDDVTGQFYYDNSSLRYKENVTPLVDDCSKLLDVSPKTYTRPDNPGVYEIGYIAEEFDAAGLNRLVWYDENGRPEGINYDKIVLYTNENVKALKEENRAQKEEIMKLKVEIDLLKKEMHERFLNLEYQNQH
jgi:hypothetical protein